MKACSVDIFSLVDDDDEDEDDDFSQNPPSPPQADAPPPPPQPQPIAKENTQQIESPLRELEPPAQQCESQQQADIITELKNKLVDTHATIEQLEHALLLSHQRVHHQHTELAELKNQLANANRQREPDEHMSGDKSDDYASLHSQIEQLQEQNRSLAHTSYRIQARLDMYEQLDRQIENIVMPSQYKLWAKLMVQKSALRDEIHLDQIAAMAYNHAQALSASDD